MKTALTTIAIVLIGAGIALVVAYNAPQATMPEVSVLRDITETHLAQPQVEAIIPLYGLDNDPWNGGHFRYQEITDVDYNKVKQAAIATAGMWLSNEFERKKEIKHFIGEIAKILADAKGDSVGKNNTSAYLPIATELNRLAQSKSEKRILLIYSDLMENGFSLSLYGKEKMDLLKNSPDSMLNYFEAQMPLERLDGITVHLIYQPHNNQDSERFRVVSEFYRAMLENKGAKVNIGANLVL